MEKYSDEMLIHRTLQGDKNAFGFLVERYKGAVHTLAYQKLGNFHDAEDIAQETFLRAYQNLTSLKKPAHFAGWLYVITTNCCKMYLRKRGRRFQANLSIEELSDRDIAKGAFGQYEQDYALQNVRDALDTLPSGEKLVLTLYYMSGMSCREIAAFIGTSANAVKDRLYRARKHLKEEMITMLENTMKPNHLGAGFVFRLIEQISTLQPISPTIRIEIGRWISIGALTLSVLLGAGLFCLRPTGPPISLGNQNSAMNVAFVDLPPGPLQLMSNQAGIPTQESASQDNTKKIKVKKIVQAIRTYDGKFRTGRMEVLYWRLNPTNHEDSQKWVQYFQRQDTHLLPKDDKLELPPIKIHVERGVATYIFSGEKIYINLREAGMRRDSMRYYPSGGFDIPSDEVRLTDVDSLRRLHLAQQMLREYAYNGQWARILSHHPGSVAGLGEMWTSGKAWTHIPIERFDVRYWMTWWGAPITDILEGQLTDFKTYLQNKQEIWTVLERKHDMRQVNFVMSSLRIREERWSDGQVCQNIRITSDKKEQFDFWINPGRGYRLEAYLRKDRKGQMMERYEADLAKTKDGTWYPRRAARVYGDYHDALEIVIINDAIFNQPIPEKQFMLTFPENADMVIDGQLMTEEN